MNGLGDLFGKPQSWFDRVNQVTINIAALLAGVSAIGKDLWDPIWREVALSGGKFDSFDYVTKTLVDDGVRLADLNNLSDRDLDMAEQDWMELSPEMNYAKKMVPELSPVVEADVSAVQSKLSQSLLKSPAAVGEKAFLDTVKERASSLGQGVTDFLKYIPWLVGGAAALYLLPSILQAFGGSRHAA